MKMVTIRPAVVEDAAGIAHVHTSTWLTTYRGLMPDDFLDRRTRTEPQAMWEQSLRSGRTSTIVAEEDGEIVGFASFGPERGNDRRYQGELYAIYILASHQRKGIGRQLLRTAAQGLVTQHFPNMMLWVLSTNPARQFYEKLGGTYLRERSAEWEGALLHEAAYGWPDLKELLQQLAGADS